MKIRFKILSGFLLIVIMLIIAGAISIYNLSKIKADINALIENNYKTIKATESMIEELEREDSGILLLLLGNWEKGRKIIETADSNFIVFLNIARNNLTEEGEIDYIRNIEKSYEKYKNLWKYPIVDTKKEGDINWYFENCHKDFQSVKNSVNELMILNQNSMYQTSSELKNTTKRAIIPGIVAIISGLIFAIIFNYFINYYIINPIIKITKGVKNFKNYGSEYNVEIETNDELKELSSSIKSLTNSYNNL